MPTFQVSLPEMSELVTFWAVEKAIDHSLVGDGDTGWVATKRCIGSGIVHLINAIKNDAGFQGASGMGTYGDVGHSQEPRNANASWWSWHVHVVESRSRNQAGFSHCRREPPVGERACGARTVVRSTS